MPDLQTKARNAFAAVGRAANAATGKVDLLAPPAYVLKRQAVCRDCPQFTGLTCGACGCFVAVKARLATERCPLNRW